MVAHIGLCDFESSLFYRVSPRTARDTQRNLVLKNQMKVKEGEKRKEKMRGDRRDGNDDGLQKISL